MSATHTIEFTMPAAPVLYVAFELSWSSWKLAFTVGAGQPARIRTVSARDIGGVMREIKKAKHRFGLPDDAHVVSCFEAGRDGFWFHRQERTGLREGDRNTSGCSARKPWVRWDSPSQFWLRVVG